MLFAALSAGDEEYGGSAVLSNFPLFIGINCILHFLHFQMNTILKQQVFVIRNRLMNHIGQCHFPNRVIFFRMLAAGIVKSLFGEAVGLFQFQ